MIETMKTGKQLSHVTLFVRFVRETGRRAHGCLCLDRRQGMRLLTRIKHHTYMRSVDTGLLAMAFAEPDMQVTSAPLRPEWDSPQPHVEPGKYGVGDTRDDDGPMGVDVTCVVGFASVRWEFRDNVSVRFSTAEVHVTELQAVVDRLA